MRRHLYLGVLALLGATGSASPAQAQVVVRAPFVYAQAGGPGPVVVRAPFFSLVVQRRISPVVLPAPPAALPAAPVAPGDPPPVPVEPPARAVTRAMTPSEFVAAFRPVAGTQEVVLEHPFTRAPVTVRFDLPPGAPRKVRVNRRVLDFDYGRRHVTIRFYRDGSVRVR
jgi:hypothetical protein